jgi:hypothetical protein
MFKGAVCAGTALACWAAVIGAVQAQDPPRQDPPRQERRDDRRDDRQDRRDDRRDDRREAVPPPATQVEQRTETRSASQQQSYKVKNVLGTKVSIQGNLAIGTVDDMIFSDDGYIDYLVVLNQSKYVLVPWQAAKFNFEQKTAAVNITQTQFQQVPTFTVQTWPNVWAPGYQERIYGYYGLRPGQDRRMERRDIRR